jgi:GNAT superfamily N-acetyltransferase
MNTTSAESKIAVRELIADDFPCVEQLFEARGACGGCWCMHWRVAKGGRTWEALKGEPNRLACKSLIESGTSHAVLAFDRKTPIGWCSFGPHEDFPRLLRTRAYQHEVAAGTWAIVCFYIHRAYRGKGLARHLAIAAIEAMRTRHVMTVEAFPVTLTKDGKQLPAAFSYTGPENLFVSLGFTEIQRNAPTRPVYELKLK